MHKFGARPIGSILTFAIRRRKDCWRVVKFLLDIGAPIDATELVYDSHAAFGNFYQGSAINIASTELCEDEVVELLLSRGARTNIQNFEGDTCLEIAKKYGSKNKVELIESYNAQLAQ